MSDSTATMISVPFTIDPVTSTIGAEVSNIDLREPMSNQHGDRLRAALVDHQVLFFRDQKLSPAQLISLARQFGAPVRQPPADQLEGFPEIKVIKRAPEETNRMTYDGRWQTDESFSISPPRAIVLYGRDVPRYGGDAIWANMCLAYETLSTGLRETLAGLSALHSAVPSSPGPALADESTSIPRWLAAAEATHPVIIEIEKNGRKALYVNESFTRNFDGWRPEESRALLRYLYEHATRPEFTCRFRWQPDSLVVWDNRSAAHRVLNDYQGHTIEMHKVAIQADAGDGKMVSE